MRAVIILSFMLLIEKSGGLGAVADTLKAPIKPQIVRTISLDVGYLSSVNSNRAIGEFDLELRQAWGTLYDWQDGLWEPKSILGRSILYAFFSTATLPFAMTQSLTYHEFGHSTRFRAVGFDTSFMNVGRGWWNCHTKSSKNLSKEDILSDNYFSTLLGMSMISLFKWGECFSSTLLVRYERNLLFALQDSAELYDAGQLELCRVRYDEQLERVKSDKQCELSTRNHLALEKFLTSESLVRTCAGGLNIQQGQARRVENHLWYNEGDHFTTVGTYFWDKTWAGFQSSSSGLSTAGISFEDGQDTSEICRAYQLMGIDLTHKEITAYSYLSYFLSAQTYANIYQIYKTLTEGENKVYAPEFWSVKLPNVALYFTTKGPTYNIGSGYRVNQTSFISVSFEFGLKESAWEATIGVRKKFPEFHDAFVHAEVVFNSEAVGGSVYGGALINKLWNVQAGVTYHNGKTLQGERNIPSYKNGDTDIEAWVKLGVAY